VKISPLALSAGDPAGTGAEIIAKAWAALRWEGPPFMVVGDARSLASAGSGVKVKTVTGPAQALDVFPVALPVLDVPLLSPVISGQPSSAHAAQIIRCIETGAGLALSGDVSGLVTAPIAKAPLYDAGFKFPGHTEFLAELTAGAPHEGVRGPVMMLTAGGLRATLVTIHKALNDVSAALSVEAIVSAAMVTSQALKRDFGVADLAWPWLPSIPTPAKAARWVARRSRSSSRPPACCATSASRSWVPPRPTPCSTPRPVPNTTASSACTTTRP
jgi:4-hydroxythreonine-4-phosphate dehydrogenase